MQQYDPRVDGYIGRAAPFAQPILKHFRQLVHETSPQITETIKWGSPFFEYKGLVCFMAAFKEHAALGFWRAYELNDPAEVIKKGEGKESRGNFGRITSLGGLPADAVLKDFILQSIALNEKS